MLAVYIPDSFYCLHDGCVIQCWLNGASFNLGAKKKNLEARSFLGALKIDYTYLGSEVVQIENYKFGFNNQIGNLKFKTVIRRRREKR